MQQEYLTRLQQAGQTISLQKNDILPKAGVVCPHMYFIQRGCLMKSFINQKGKEVIHGFYLDEACNMLSETGSFYTGSAAFFHIKALEDSALIVLNKAQLEHLVLNAREFALFLYETSARSVRDLYLFSAMRLAMQPTDFFYFLIKQHPAYVRRIPEAYLASFIGISREMLVGLKALAHLSEEKQGC